MRITFTTQYRETQAALNKAQDTLTAYTRQVSSGKRLTAPSDDPQAAATSVNAHAEAGTLDRYASATDSTSSRLAVVDSALSDLVSQLTSAKTLAASARSTFINSAQKQAIAVDLQGVKEALASDLATSYQGTYVFSGTKTTTTPYTISGGVVSSYQGNAATTSVDVDRHMAIQTTFDGESLTRGADVNDVFQEFDALITAVQNGDSAGIDAGIDAIDRAFGRVTNVQSSVGSSLSRLEDQSARLTTVRQGVQSQISSLEDADLVEAINGLQAAQTAQRAALGAASTINQQSLMDYLK